MNIVTVSDSPISSSGVAQQMNLFIRHFEPDNKIISLSIGKTQPIQVTPNWGVVYLGKSDKAKQENLLQVLESEKIDYLFFMTDPRFFMWILPIEYKIKTLCPNIIYYHVWDSDPVPEFNKSFYDVFDHIACISKLTYNHMRQMGYKNSSYIPHTLPKEIYRLQLSEQKRFSNKFTVLWDSRNMFRKSPACAVEAFSIFHKKHKDSFLVMKTDPILAEGVDMSYILNYYGLKPVEDCVLLTDKLSLNGMNQVYNACDCVLSTSLAEGFGLSALMALKTGKVLIAPKIGGLQDQADNKVGFCVTPDFSYNFASVTAPVIYFHFVKPQTYAKFLEQAYYFSPEKRSAFAKNGQEKYENNFSNELFFSNWDKVIKKEYEQRNMPLENFVQFKTI